MSDPNAVRRLVGQTGRLDFVPLGSVQKNAGDKIDPAQFPTLFSGERLSSAAIATDQTGKRVVTFTRSSTARRCPRIIPREHRQVLLRSSRRKRHLVRTISAIPGGNVQISQDGIGGTRQGSDRLVTVLQFGRCRSRSRNCRTSRSARPSASSSWTRSLLAGANRDPPGHGIHADRLTPPGSSPASPSSTTASSSSRSSASCPSP